MLNWFFNIKRAIKTKSYRLAIFEIVLFGILLAIYMVTAWIENKIIPGVARISITYAIFIIFGIALGPWKGAFLGILCDTIKQVIFGIGTWMIEYAIIPIIIAFISGYLIKTIYIYNKGVWIFGFSILAIITIILTIFLIFNDNIIKWKETSLKQKPISSFIVWIISTISISVIWAISFVLFGIHLKTKNFKKKYHTQLLFWIIISVFIIIILVRWLWGPFAYISYHNRFRNGSWKYSQYYFIFMIPIIFKSLIEIPVYGAIIFAIFPLIKKIHEKISFHSSKIFTY
ncbi:ECF transporter S component [Metamycoplasma buccale]|uniref:ECF transporter S component n=1 Tax=Metamycoplasma buccale TaxID=55602 RepID=UPI00398EA036